MRTIPVDVLVHSYEPELADSICLATTLTTAEIYARLCVTYVLNKRGLESEIESDDTFGPNSFFKGFKTLGY